MTPDDELLDLARLLLTPNARVGESDTGSPRGVGEWEKARIRWHRLDGNDALADEMLRDTNAVRRALNKEPLDA